MRGGVRDSDGFSSEKYEEERFILLLEGLKDNNCASTINKNIGQGLSYEMALG